eukprot:7337461-Prymnesium_polylepis.1
MPTVRVASPPSRRSPCPTRPLRANMPSWRSITPPPRVRALSPNHSPHPPPPRGASGPRSK